MGLDRRGKRTYPQRLQHLQGHECESRLSLSSYLIEIYVDVGRDDSLVPGHAVRVRRTRLVVDLGVPQTRKRRGNFGGRAEEGRSVAPFYRRTNGTL